MPETMFVPETRAGAPEIQQVVRLLEDLLDPDGPYRWDLPPQALKVGDPGYDFFVCRTSVYLGQILALESLVRSGALAKEQENAVSDALAGLQAVKRKPGLKTSEDMKVLRNGFTEALMALYGLEH